ncbi:MAG: SIMPL domain-containing protein [Peptostreptococcaceae bacterium]|jgi:hypothetical protein|nr:SIMPL domain-containing protein [Peptostreptococcaceae bacterium]
MNNFKNWVLVVVSIILSLGIIVSSAIMTNGFIKVKETKNELVVKGSSKQQIKSDLVVWTGSFSYESANLSDAYLGIKESERKVKAYLQKSGVEEDQIVMSSINTIKLNKRLPYGNGYSNEVEKYRLVQDVKIESKEIDKITQISRKSTDLINEGVEFESYPPSYLYTKLADLKVEMIGKATKDAKERAQKMLEVTGNSVGKLNSARVGIFQITPLYSNEVSDYGINDNSSIDKEITAVVTCSFEVK